MKNKKWLSISRSCSLVGVSRYTLHKWLKKYPDIKREKESATLVLVEPNSLLNNKYVKSYMARRCRTVHA